MVQWGEVPAADQNGVILSYTVTYDVFSESDDTPISKVVSAPKRNLTLTDLNEFTTSSITVLASTSKGNGESSEAIKVTSDEDSKYQGLIVETETLEVAATLTIFSKHPLGLSRNTLSFSVVGEGARILRDVPKRRLRR